MDPGDVPIVAHGHDDIRHIEIGSADDPGQQQRIVGDDARSIIPRNHGIAEPDDRHGSNDEFLAVFR